MTDETTYESPNFHFLATVDPLLVELGARAEHYALDDPNTSMLKIRQLGELLAQSAAAKFGIQTDSRNQEQRGLIDDLYRRRFLPPDIKDLFLCMANSYFKRRSEFEKDLCSVSSKNIDRAGRFHTRYCC